MSLLEHDSLGRKHILVKSTRLSKRLSSRPVLTHWSFSSLPPKAVISLWSSSCFNLISCECKWWLVTTCVRVKSSSTRHGPLDEWDKTLHSSFSSLSWSFDPNAVTSCCPVEGDVKPGCECRLALVLTCFKRITVPCSTVSPGWAMLFNAGITIHQSFSFGLHLCAKTWQKFRDRWSKCHVSYYIISRKLQLPVRHYHLLLASSLVAILVRSKIPTSHIVL